MASLGWFRRGECLNYGRKKSGETTKKCIDVLKEDIRLKRRKTL